MAKRTARVPKDEREKALVSNFDAKGNLPAAWWIIGTNLIKSAEVLGRLLVFDPPPSMTAEEGEAFALDARVRGSTLMLRGCAAECLLKALYLDAGNVLAGDGELIRPPGVPDHDLIRLANASGFALSSEEHSLLRVLGYWIKQGRYPLMASWLQYPSFSPTEKALAPNWDSECEELWIRLQQRFTRDGRRLAEKGRPPAPAPR